LEGDGGGFCDALADHVTELEIASANTDFDVACCQQRDGLQNVKTALKTLFRIRLLLHVCRLLYILDNARDDVDHAVKQPSLTKHSRHLQLSKH